MYNEVSPLHRSDAGKENTQYTGNTIEKSAFSYSGIIFCSFSVTEILWALYYKSAYSKAYLNIYMWSQENTVS